jgi:uncharacterized protein (DUF2252 family)
MIPAPTQGELESLGRGLRSRVVRRSHGEFQAHERDPIDVLEAQATARIPELVPVLYGRMMQTPYAYYLGSAAVMAGDLATGVVTGPRVVCAGDAHPSNFALFDSASGLPAFDVIDFDEAAMAPWEWDLKRLAAGVVVAGRETGSRPSVAREATVAAVAKYRESLREMTQLTVLERFLDRADADQVAARAASKKRRKALRPKGGMRRRTSDRTLDRLSVSGSTIVDQPPLTRRVAAVDRESVQVLFDQYRGSVRADAAQALARFRLVDLVLRVVGVGSVGARSFVAHLLGPGDESLFLQVREANPSVLEIHGGITPTVPESLSMAYSRHQGYRVVACQRILQTRPDPFLGWISVEEEGPSGPTTTDYYWRQFRDVRAAVDVQSLTPSALEAYAGLCSMSLARAHAQSPHGLTAAAYMGKSGTFDEAVADWASAYADQVERDHESLVKAARSGRMTVHEDA